MGRPGLNPNMRLSDRKKSILIGTLLGDGSISKPDKPSHNAKIRLTQSTVNKQLIDEWYKNFREYIHAPVREQTRLSPSSSNKVKVLNITTRTHPEFTKLIPEFGGAGVDKTVPKVSFLKDNLDWEGLAYLFMMDGSKKSDPSKGVEIHTQGFEGFAPTARLCLALYEKFGLMASPTLYAESNDTSRNSTGISQYNVYISGHSLPLLTKHMQPYLLSDFLYKLPSPHVRELTNTEQRSWDTFYEQYKDAAFREDLSIFIDKPPTV